MAKVTITNPPPFKAYRRKCGWGSVITTCNVCGKIMVGHNRGICSKCMRMMSGDRRPYERIYRAPHIGIKASSRDMIQAAKTLNIAASKFVAAKFNAKKEANA